MGLGIKTRIRQVFTHAFVLKFPAFRKSVWGDTTQYGEFWTLWNLCDRGINGHVVEVGANDGVYCSNSYPFIERGWRATLIEPNPAMHAKLRRRYGQNKRVKLFNVACGSEESSSLLFLGKDGADVYATLCTEDSWWYKETRSSDAIPVQVLRLDTVLESAQCPSKFEILSIDTEGFDYHVLAGLSLERFQPKVIITEDEKPPFTYKQKKDTLLIASGYKFFRNFADNAIWIRSP